jgi:hypothetical protein
VVIRGLGASLMQIMGRNGLSRQNVRIMPPIPQARCQTAATRRVHDAMRHPRLARELATLSAMIEFHCREIHGNGAGLCENCADLLAYATRRLDRCVFGDDKPTCANCTVHCYSAAKRDEVRAVMRYAGPRMIWRHPLLAIRHLLDRRRTAPSLPTRPR